MSPILELTCPHCGVSFPKPPTRQKYCSRECRAKANWTRNSEKLKKVFKEWYIKNKDHDCRKAREYYHKNREHALQVRDEYRKTHLEAECLRKLTKSVASAKLFPWKNLLKSSFERSKVKNIPFDLTPEWAANRWTGFCEMTCLPFVLGAGSGVRGPRPYSPTIDKIDPLKGYTIGNCRFIIQAVNALKGSGTDEDVYRIAEALLANRSK
jgi:hypothetical protein